MWCQVSTSLLTLLHGADFVFLTYVSKPKHFKYIYK